MLCILSSRLLSLPSLSPYTTLFRSGLLRDRTVGRDLGDGLAVVVVGIAGDPVDTVGVPFLLRGTARRIERVRRSEEHTSEIQSLRHLVCRLLLLIKKNNIIDMILNN